MNWVHNRIKINDKKNRKILGRPDNEDFRSILNHYDNGGLVIINGDTINSDRLEVNTITDDNSLISDLGTVAFDSIQTIPLSTDYADHAFAAPGHVYVVHTKDTDSDFYTKFIITAMKKRDWIRINWVRSADGLSFK